MSSPVITRYCRPKTPRRNQIQVLPLNVEHPVQHQNNSQDLQNDEDESGRTSPIFQSQRANRASQRSRDFAPSWKKSRSLRYGLSRPHKATGNLSNSPTVLHDDSFLDGIDFDEIDSMCQTTESTPKRKVRHCSKRNSSQKNLQSCSYSLRETPQRARALEYKENSLDLFPDVKEKWGGPKHTVSDEGTIQSNITAVSESSYSSSDDIFNKNLRIKPLETTIQNGRRSPDLFGEEDDFEFSRDHLSESMDAAICLIEDDYYNSSCESKDLFVTKKKSVKNAALPVPLREVPANSTKAVATTIKSQKLSSINQSSVNATALNDKPIQLTLNDSFLVHPMKDPSQRTSVDSQISFSSTLESQSLIDRLEDRLKNVSESQQAAEVMCGVGERRAAAVAAALKEAVKTHVPGEDLELGPFFGLPSTVPKLLKEHRGISKLYEWQESCIKAGSGGSNLLICQPTSGGKTLVAEVIILQHLLLRRRHAIFVLPYIALVQEKVRGLSAFGVELGFLVEEYAGSRGSFPPKARKNKKVVYVATLEKAGGLVNWMVEAGEEKAADSVGVVVVDEVHMLSEDSRGATLEATITKLRFAAPKVQLVAMSATVGNLKELADFLGAELHTGNFRPVTLTEHIKVGDDIYEINPRAVTEEDTFKKHRIACYPYTEEQLYFDKDHVGGLVGEVVPQHSCLVFCPTKRSCEAVAEMLCKVLPTTITEFRHKEKVSLYRALIEEGGGSVCPVLRKTIPFGVSYHHSGMTEGERRLLEEGYLAGTLCCICCTSTLAAGVNLPARRVIIRAPLIGRVFLCRSRYKQMIGRAGRAGLDTFGESFLILQPRQLPQAQSILVSNTEDCCSTLTKDGDRGLTSLVFSAVALGVATSLSSLTCLVNHSLWAQQEARLSTNVDIYDKIRNLIESLRKKGLVRIKLEVDKQCQDNNAPEKGNKESPVSTITTVSALNSLEDNAVMAVGRPVAEGDVLTVSRLGHAAIKGNIDLDIARRLYVDLCVAREHLAVNCHLHLLYLVTPYNPLATASVVPQVLYSAYMALGEEELMVARLLGITEGVVVKLSIGHRSKHVDWEVVERFYVALLLHQVWGGAGIWEASHSFHVHRGFTQQIITSAAAFASCIFHFCQELEELWAFRDLLANFTQQLSGCCAVELLPLMDLPAVKRGRARQLYKAGYHTLQDVARADVGSLVKIVDHLSYSTAAKLINSAKMLLLERAETLQVEAEEVLLGLRGPLPSSPANDSFTSVPDPAPDSDAMINSVPLSIPQVNLL